MVRSWQARQGGAVSRHAVLKEKAQTPMHDTYPLNELGGAKDSREEEGPWRETQTPFNEFST